MKLLLTVFIYGFAFSATALPIELKHGEGDWGEIMIEVTFDGKPHKIKLDTGANYTQMRKDIWNADYTALRQRVMSGASGSHYTCDVIEFQSASVEELNVPKYQASRCDIATAEELFSIDFFANKVLGFDFENGRLNLDAIGDEGKLPLTLFPRGHIGVEIQIDHQPYLGVFDTGAGLTSVDQNFVDRNPSAFEFVEVNETKDGAGNPLKINMYKLKSLEIDGVNVSGELAAAFPFPPTLIEYFGERTPLIIGFNIITMQNWTIDLKRKTWSLKKQVQ